MMDYGSFIFVVSIVILLIEIFMISPWIIISAVLTVIIFLFANSKIKNADIKKLHKFKKSLRLKSTFRLEQMQKDYDGNPMERIVSSVTMGFISTMFTFIIQLNNPKNFAIIMLMYIVTICLLVRLAYLYGKYRLSYKRVLLIHKEFIRRNKITMSENKINSFKRNRLKKR